MTTSRIALLVMVACCSFAAVGCSSENRFDSRNGDVDADIQHIKFDLTSLDGASIEALSYTLTNTTTGVVKSGMLDVSHEEDLTLSLLLRPGNYGIAFIGNGTFEDEDVPCAGSADFTVVAESNPPLHVDIVCEAGESTEVTPVETGDVDVNATLTVNREVIEGECGFTDAFIGPLNQLVGQPINTEADFVVAYGATGTVTWSASAGLGGAFANAAAASTTYTCSDSGTGTITATLQSDIEGCNDTVVANVTCLDEVPAPSENLLSSRGSHVCRVLSGEGARRLVCWGRERDGALGNGALAVDQNVANIVDTRHLEDGLATRWRSIHTGIATSCAITVAGQAYCWGRSSTLGNGASLNSDVPTPVDISGLPPGTTWSKVAPGLSDSNCGITSQGTAYCWGGDTQGKLGNGSAASQLLPFPVDVSALPPETTWSTISAGTAHTCGLTSAGAAYCWGSDSNGMLGNGAGTTASQQAPSVVDSSALPPGTTWTSVTLGQQHACALTSQGQAYCWGNDSNGQLGNGTLGASPSPSPVDMTALSEGVTFTQLSAGHQHTCGLTSDGSAWCWGTRALGRLGNGSDTGTAPSPVAVDVSLIPEGTRFKALSAGELHTCGLTANDEVYCWGSNQYGQLGTGADLSLPQLRPALGAAPATIGVVLSHAAFSGTVGVDNPQMPFTVIPLEGSTDDLIVMATSSDESIIPSASITATGTGSERLLSFEPIASGLIMTITVVVANSAGEYSFTFQYGASAMPPDQAGVYYYHISDASTALDVGDGYVLLANDETNAQDAVLFLYKQDEAGFPLKTWGFTEQLGDEELDIEGAARVGNTIVWNASQGNSSKDGAREERRRVTFATTISGSGADVELSFAGRYGGGPGSKAALANLGLWADLRAWDKANGHGMGADALGFEAATQSGVFPTAPSGFNIEGLEFASDGTTGYLGFRAPTIDVDGTQRALIVPLTNILSLVNGIGPQSGQAQFGAPILLDLAGRSIRELRRNASGEYLISASPPDNATNGVNDTWALYTWAGVGHEAVFNRELPNADLLTGGTWESIASVPDPLQSGGSVRLVTDSGDTVYYGYEQAKDLETGHQKAYSQVFTLD